MQLQPLNQAIHVAGIELRTTNDQAMHTIPGHWARFAEDNILASLANRLSDDVFAVYTHFANAGSNNRGAYSLIIGGQIAPDANLPTGLVRATVPASPRAVFDVEGGQMEKVVNTWQTIWLATDLPKSFVAEYEQYHHDGRISVSIGLHGPLAGQ